MGVVRVWARFEMKKFVPSLSHNLINSVRNVWSAMSLSLLVPEEKKLPISINFYKKKRLNPLDVNTTLYRNSSISRCYSGKTIKIEACRLAQYLHIYLRQKLHSVKGGGGGGGGGGFSPDFCKNTILRYELAMMARTCTNNLRVVISPYVHHCPCEASEQKLGQKTNI